MGITFLLSNIGVLPPSGSVHVTELQVRKELRIGGHRNVKPRFFHRNYDFDYFRFLSVDLNTYVLVLVPSYIPCLLLLIFINQMAHWHTHARTTPFSCPPGHLRALVFSIAIVWRQFKNLAKQRRQTLAGFRNR